MATGKTKADAVRARAAEMVAMFEAALDGEPVSPIRRLKLHRAADLSALAEAIVRHAWQARRRWPP